MIRKCILLLSTAALMLSCAVTKKDAASSADKTITIKGKVQFIDTTFKMAIVRRDGFDKKEIVKFDVNPDGTYQVTMPVEEPGVYTLDCMRWQEVSFWAEDENLEINFRGMDTARMKIKNPPYVYINGGKNNEVMNQLNYTFYRNYQMMIAMSQAAYKNVNPTQFATEYGALTSSIYDALGSDVRERYKMIAEMYGDRNAVIAVLSNMSDTRDGETIDKIVARFETINPNYAPLVKYKKAIEEARYQRERLAIGKPAPEFSYPTPEGDKNIALSDFKGKIVVVDFWASWCGPCRQEIPHMKEIYGKYKAQGVEFFSVSIDKKDADWKNALKEEKMAWPQVCAPNAGKELMQEYQFTGIPYIIIVDAEGNIFAKGLRGKGVDKAIDEALAAAKK